MSNRINGKPLWWVRPINGMEVDEASGHVFTGPRSDMVCHISRLHRETGKQHAAKLVG